MEQVRAILTEIPQRTRALFWCVGLLGVRLGELLGLKWKHINFENRTLTIAQSLWEGQLVTPKTEGSIRTLPFGDFLAKVLTDHMQSAEHIGLEDFVFCKTDGMPYHPDVPAPYPEAIKNGRLPCIPSRGRKLG